MISLGSLTRAPSTKNTLPPLEKKPFSSIVIGGGKAQFNAKFSVSLPKICKVLASSSDNVAVQYGDEVKESMEVEHKLPEGLRAQLMPNHVAVIMDGNRRWARQRDLPVMHGHTAGKEAVKELARLCSKWGIKALTVFAFSTENWSRPKEEVDFLMNFFEEVVKLDPEEFMRYGHRITVIGNRSMLSKSLQKAVAQAEETTKSNSGTQLNIAINYGGRYDILQACKAIANKTKDGLLQLNQINESIFEQELETKCIAEFQNPELLIRTSGELRISNFLLWQLAYSELYFVEKMFPDFGEADFIEALRSFQKRRRDDMVDTSIREG